MKKIIFLKADGTITVRIPVASERRPDETEDAFLDRVAAAHPVRTGIVVRHAKLDYDMPVTHKDYRAARTLTIDNKVTYDMPKARNMHRDMIRERREELFKALDKEAIIALTSGGNNTVQLARINNDKQKLRDAPADPRIEAAQTLDQLIGVDPLS